MKKSLLLALLTLLVAMFAAACGTPTPEKLCEGAEEKDRKECTEGLTEMKKALDAVDESLWPEMAKCLKDKDFKKKEEVMKCAADEAFSKKVEEAAKKKAGK